MSYFVQANPADYGEQIIKKSETFLNRPFKPFNMLGCEMNCCCICIGRNEKEGAMIAGVMAVGSAIAAALFALSSFVEALQISSDIAEAKQKLKDQQAIAEGSPETAIYKSSVNLLEKKCIERAGSCITQMTMAGGLGILSVALIFVLLEAEAMAAPICLPGLVLAGGGAIGYFANAGIYAARRENDVRAIRTAKAKLEQPSNNATSGLPPGAIGRTTYYAGGKAHWGPVLYPGDLVPIPVRSESDSSQEEYIFSSDSE